MTLVIISQCIYVLKDPSSLAPQIFTILSWVWYSVLVIPAPREAKTGGSHVPTPSLSDLLRPCLKNKSRSDWMLSSKVRGSIPRTTKIFQIIQWDFAHLVFYTSLDLLKPWFHQSQKTICILSSLLIALLLVSGNH